MQDTIMTNSQNCFANAQSSPSASSTKQLIQSSISRKSSNNQSLMLKDHRKIQNKSVMDEVNNISNTIKMHSVSHLENQRAKRVVEFDKNLHLNRDTSIDNPLKRETRRKKAEGLRHFTHSFL